MRIRPIDTTKRSDWRRFHRVTDHIYARDPHWISPLHQDIEDIFSDKNAAAATGHYRLWILENDGGKPIGRIAAFADTRRWAENAFPTGGVGFFESPNNPEAARLLLQTAEDYLRKLGVAAIDGLINFGERDKFWGLLTHGWYPPVYQESYHPPYYRRFFEDFGFRDNEQCLTMRGDIKDFYSERLQKLSDMIKARHGYHCVRIERNNLEQGAEWFATAYNQAFKHWPYFKPLTGAEILPTFKAMKPIMDPHLTCITFDGDRPIGLGALIPDLNRYFKGLNGKLRWYQIPWFLYRLKYRPEPGCKGIAFGIDAEYQRKGVFPVMIEFMFKTGNEHNSRVYGHVDLATIRGHNDIMVETCYTMGVSIHRVHQAYRKAIQPGLEWEPFKQLDVSEVDMGEVPDESIYPRE